MVLCWNPNFAKKLQFLKFGISTMKILPSSFKVESIMARKSAEDMWILTKNHEILTRNTRFSIRNSRFLAEFSSENYVDNMKTQVSLIWSLLWRAEIKKRVELTMKKFVIFRNFRFSFSLFLFFHLYIQYLLNLLDNALISIN